MEDIVLLRDDSQNPQELPTKENMVSECGTFPFVAQADEDIA